MALGRVGADQQHQIGEIQIVVAAGRSIGAQAAAVAGDGRAHAQPRIGIKVVAAQGSLEQLVGNVIVLAQKLPGAIHRQGLRALASQGRADAFHQQPQRPLPTDRRERLVETLTPQGCRQAVAVQGLSDRGPLDADLTQ